MGTGDTKGTLRCLLVALVPQDEGCWAGGPQPSSLKFGVLAHRGPQGPTLMLQWRATLPTPPQGHGSQGMGLRGPGRCAGFQWPPWPLGLTAMLPASFLLTFRCSCALACPSPSAALEAGERGMGQRGVPTGIALCWGALLSWQLLGRKLRLGPARSHCCAAGRLEGHLGAGQAQLLLLAWPCESLPGDAGDGASTLQIPTSLSRPAPQSWVCAGRPVLPVYPSES